MEQPFIDAIIQAANTRANFGASPAQTAANAGQIGNLQNLANLKFISAGANTAGVAGAGNAGAVADQQEASRRAAEAEAEINLKEQMRVRDIERAKSDPKNFQRVLNDAGGYTFTDGAGKPISVNDYARANNISISEALKGSADPSDVDFTKDYDDTIQLGRIMATGNKKELDKFYEDRPGLKKYLDDNDIKTYSSYVQRFRSAYPDRFSQAQANSQATRTVAPNLNLR